MDELFRDRYATRVEILIFHDQYDDRFLFFIQKTYIGTWWNSDRNLDVWYMLTCIWDQLLKIRIYNQITQIKQAK